MNSWSHNPDEVLLRENYSKQQIISFDPVLVEQLHIFFRARLQRKPYSNSIISKRLRLILKISPLVLTEKQYSIFFQYYVLGFKEIQVAKNCQISQSLISIVLDVCRKKLKKAIVKHGFSGRKWRKVEEEVREDKI